MAAQVERHLNLTPMTKDGMNVGVANDERLPCLGVCSMLSFSINDEPFYIDFLIIALEGYEVVLGCNWLRTLRPIVWDFSHLSMVFWWLDRWVKWTGLPPLARRCLLSPPTTSCNFFWWSSRMSSPNPRVCLLHNPSTTAFTYCRLHGRSSFGLIGTHTC
jgi:hypothetical protein